MCCFFIQKFQVRSLVPRPKYITQLRMAAAVTYLGLGTRPPRWYEIVLSAEPAEGIIKWGGGGGGGGGGGADFSTPPC